MEGNYYWVDLVAYWVRLNPLHLLQMCSSYLKSSISALKLFDISDVVSVIAQITGYQKNCRTHWLHKTPLCNHKSLFPRRGDSKRGSLFCLQYVIEYLWWCHGRCRVIQLCHDVHFPMTYAMMSLSYDMSLDVQDRLAVYLKNI